MGRREMPISGGERIAADRIGVMEPLGPSQLPDSVNANGAFEVVVEGYDAVYASVAASPTFGQLWAEHACGGAFPAEFAHISFLTLDELRDMADYLALGKDAVLADLACGGGGGPGLWAAMRSGALLFGVDPSWAGLAQARKRVGRVALADRARYQQGTFAMTGLADKAADGALSVDAMQYAPDKSHMFREIHRILRPGGRLAFSAFEVEPERVDGLPVFGVRPRVRLRPAARSRRLLDRLVQGISRLDRARRSDVRCSHGDPCDTNR